MCMESNSGFKVESWWYTTLWMAPWASCSSQCSLHNLATVHLSTLSCPVIAFSEASFLPQIWVVVVETVLTPGWVLIQVNFTLYSKRAPKSRSGCSFARLWFLHKLELCTCTFDACSQELYPISSFNACFYSDAHISIDGFYGAWLHFRRAIVGVCVYHSWYEIQASKHYVESLPLVLKNKRSCFSQGERLAVQLPLARTLALRK